jgi:hypothetical protein
VSLSPTAKAIGSPSGKLCPLHHRERGHRHAMLGFERRSTRGTTPPGAAEDGTHLDLLCWGYLQEGCGRHGGHSLRRRCGDPTYHRGVSLCLCRVARLRRRYNWGSLRGLEQAFFVSVESLKRVLPKAIFKIVLILRIINLSISPFAQSIFNFLNFKLSVEGSTQPQPLQDVLLQF